ncbi:MAG: CPBP family intramembrane metalloprotease [Bacteroidales bacterium]|nr:CPBP family intramembrane metalloprotease [Bacteroidales bacterium]
MKAKKLLVFALFAFLPMVAVGLVMHFIGGTAGIDTEAPADMTAALKGFVLSAGSMLIPLLAVVFTQLIFKEPVLRNVGLSFKVNKWWWIGWILMPVIAFACLGVTLLMPGAQWAGNSEAVQTAVAQIPGAGIWGMIIITVLSGMIAGITINAVFALGEEIAWRGFLLKELEGKSFLAVAIGAGAFWGFWHSPLILNGHNYPDHPVAGVFMMIVLCILMTPMLMYFRKKSGSVIVPAIMHGTINAVAGITQILVTPSNDLLYGSAGLAGFIVFLIVDLCIFIYDRYITKENLMLSAL